MEKLTCSTKVSQEAPMRDREWFEKYPYHKIWCNEYCPFVPRVHVRKADEYNASGWTIQWLIFTVWSLDHFEFGVDANVSFRSVYIGAILPYLRIVVGVRHIMSETSWKITRFLSRKPKTGVQ